MFVEPETGPKKGMPGLAGIVAIGLLGNNKTELGGEKEAGSALSNPD